MTTDELWCCVRVRSADNSVLAHWRLAGAGPPDLGLVHGLARAHLAATRVGCRLEVTDVSREFAELLRLAGLEHLGRKVAR